MAKQGVLGMAVVTILIVVGAAMASQTLDIRSNIRVSGSQILLSDLVSMTAGLPEGWAERPVLSAPLPKQSQPLPLTSIAYALQQYPDMTDVMLRGNVEVTVHRDGTNMDESRMHEAIREFVEETSPWSELETGVEVVQIPSRVAVPTGGYDLRVSHYEAVNEQQGLYAFTVDILVDEQVQETLIVRASVITMQEVWTAARSLNKGRILGSDDLGTTWIPSNRRGNFVPVDEVVEGMEADRAFRSGQPLVRSFLAQPLCVERGDWVNVRVQRESLRVTLRARALARGRLGSRILCVNEQTSRRLLVQLVAPREAVLWEQP